MSKKKKGTRESSPPTNVSSTLRGPNQDQGGYGVSHNTADYTISDETQYDEGFVAGVGAVRGTPVQMSSMPRGKRHKNSPGSAGGLQRAADKRRMQLDRLSQKRAAAQKRIGRRQQAEELSYDPLISKASKGSKMPKDKVTSKFKNFSSFAKAIDEDKDPCWKGYEQIGTKKKGGRSVPNCVPVKEEGGDNDRPIMPEPVSNPTIRKYGKEFVAKSLEPLTLIGQGAHEGDAKKVATGVAKGVAKAAGLAGGLPGVAAGAVIDAAADKFGKKATNEEVENLEEGRPKKNATSDDPGSEHIVMQLRKAISLRGQHPVKFVNGKSSMVSPATAHRLLGMHDNMKTAAEKDAFAKHIHKSVDHMRDALAGKKPEPETKKISLGGSHGNNDKR